MRPRPGFYLRHPTAIAHRLWRFAYDLRHPGHPWLAPKAIQILDRALTAGMRGLEWGSGRSTLWFAQRLGGLTSVESDPAWHAKVTQQLRAGGHTNVDLRLIEIAETDQNYWEPNDYVMVSQEFEDASLDLVLIDGLFRQTCVGWVLPKVRPGGYLVIDQSFHLPDLSHWGVPAEWEMLHRGTRMLDTTIWRRPDGGRS